MISSSECEHCARWHARIKLLEARLAAVLEIAAGRCTVSWEHDDSGKRFRKVTGEIKEKANGNPDTNTLPPLAFERGRG